MRDRLVFVAASSLSPFKNKKTKQDETEFRYSRGIKLAKSTLWNVEQKWKAREETGVTRSATC